MNWIIPGTTIQADREEARYIENQFTAMFLGGGIMLSQVTEITGLEPYTVQNWVKRGFLTSPDHKRYNLNQLCRIIHINMLKKVLPMEQIVGLLGHINGKLGDTSDDLIDDSQLYFMFVHLAAGFFCLLSLPRCDQPVFYLTMAVWMFSDLCNLTPMPRAVPETR